MNGRSQSRKSFVEITTSITSFAGILATCFLGFQAVVKAVFGTTENNIYGFVAFGIILLFLACVYLNYFWQPVQVDVGSSEPSILQPIEAQAKYRQEFARRKKDSVKRRKWHKWVKRFARTGSVVIPFLVLADLLLWFSVNQSLLWRDLYLAELDAKEIPELIRLCSSSNYKIQVKHPDSWSCQKVETKLTQTVFTLTPNGVDGSLETESPTLVIQVYPLLELQSLDQVVSNRIELLQEERFDSFQLLENEPSSFFLQQKGRKLVYETKMADRSGPVKYMEFIALKNQVAYYGIYFSDNVRFPRQQRAVIEMVKNIKLLD
ncbi:MAG: hypothetical protein AB8B99_11485 [Phormidesmis sp.]